MADDERATASESGALAHVHEANVQLRQLVHQFLTRRVTLAPDEALQTQRKLAALALGAAWLHARLRDTIASGQDDDGSHLRPDRGAIFPDAPDGL